MGKLIAARTAQYPLAAEFTFNFDDTMVNSVGNEVDFGAANAGGAAGIFTVIPLPVGATVTGGSVTTDTAFDTAGYDVTVGDSGVADRYLTSTDKKGTGLTALVPTGFVGNGEDIRIAFSSDDVCTTGKMTVRVEYTIAGRANENTLT
jgi:hypothetical protein